MPNPNEITMSFIINAIDWVSIKLNTPGIIILLAIDTSTAVKVFGLLSIISTIVYNSIRIYKEIRNKK